jgi:hypothetical protein
MKRLLLIIIVLITLSLACSIGNQTDNGSEPQVQGELPPQSEKRCGDNVCDGPENTSNCPQDCSGSGQTGGDSNAADETTSQDNNDINPPEIGAPGEVAIGIIYAETQLDRTAGEGNCGIDPWYSPDCSSLKIWWGLHLEAIAQTAVLIIPDGDDRWVVSNHPEVVSNYNLNLNDFFNNAGGSFNASAIDFSPVSECSGTIEVSDFKFQVMGTRQDDILELILSANPTEYVEGACAGTGFNYSTTEFLYGWAAALSGDPLDLRFQMNDTFRQLPGSYSFTTETDTNPSPEKRDHVQTRLEFMCVGSQPASVLEPVACPWEH